jgi:hypothetical protein
MIISGIAGTMNVVMGPTAIDFNSYFGSTTRCRMLGIGMESVFFMLVWQIGFKDHFSKLW